MDMLLATGEQVSVSLMAITMIQMGVSAVSLNAWQIPMHTTSDYQNARFKRIDTERIRKELDDNKIVIVTGFRGSTNTMISQRSDAAAPIRLRLPSLQSCTRMSVNLHGCRRRLHRRSADCTECAQMEEVTYDEMLEMASLGAKSPSQQMRGNRKKYGVELGLLQSEPEFRNDGKGENQNGKMLISGVAADKMWQKSVLQAATIRRVRSAS